MNLRDIIKRMLRNHITLNGDLIFSNTVNLEYWNSQTNLGDHLALVVYKWILQKNNINSNKTIRMGRKKPVHLLTIGSIIGIAPFDATIWGSGVHSKGTMKNVFDMRKFCNYDIRAVRGPVSYTILSAAGFNCPKVFGDPAILMPLIYNPSKQPKKYDISIIYHLSQRQLKKNSNYHYIDIQTTNYKKFIDEILASKLIISSSLHGIILAESYGVPTIFLSRGRENEFMKYLDWYYSTERFNIKFAKSIDEALEMEPMELPKLNLMRKKLLRAFPYDLWVK